MEKLELNKTPKLIVAIEGKDYPLDRPTLGAQADLEDALNTAKTEGKGASRVLIAYMVSCGLPEPVVRNLEGGQLEALTEALGSSKKKSAQ